MVSLLIGCAVLGLLYSLLCDAQRPELKTYTFWFPRAVLIVGKIALLVYLLANVSVLSAGSSLAFLSLLAGMLWFQYHMQREIKERQTLEIQMEALRADVMEARDRTKTLMHDLDLRSIKIQQQEQTIDTTLGQLEHSSKLEKRLIGNLGFLLRTRMNSIIGMLDLLRESGLNRVQHHYSGTIRSSAYSIMVFVRNISDFVRFKAGQLADERRPVAIQRMVRDLVQPYQDICEDDKKLSIRVHVAPSVPASVMVDEEKMASILCNLLEYACSVLSVGEIQVHLGALRRKDGQWDVTLALTSSRVFLSLEKWSRLVDESLYEEKSKDPLIDSSLFSLGLSYYLAQSMGGTLTYTTSGGQTGRFALTVPAQEAYLPHQEEGETPCYEQVYVVGSDDVSDRDYLISLLEKKKYAVRAVPLEEAMSKRGEENSLLILDIDLHNLAAVKKVLPKIALRRGFIVLSGYSRAELASHGLVLNDVIPCLKKPFEAAHLLAAMEQTRKNSPFGDKGTHSSVMPLKNQKTEHPATDVSSTTITAADLKVLVVEDNKVNQMLLRSVLEKIGITAKYVQDGEVALFHARKTAFDLIFMDIVLPRMSGIEATQKIRALPTGKTTHVVGMTASDRVEDRDGAFQAGMGWCLLKPVQIDKIRAVIDEILKKKSSRRTTPRALKKVPA